MADKRQASSDPSSPGERVYIILGGSGGIGSAAVRALAAGGAKVTVAGPDDERLVHLADEVGGRPYPLDATDFEAVDCCVRDTLEAFGRVDGLLNCVGSLHLKPAHLTSYDEWVDVVQRNLTSAFAAVRAAGLHLRDSGGSVVLMASAAARLGLANHEAIAAAKGGVIGLTVAAAATYARSGIRVNAVAPGLVETPLTERITRHEGAASASRRLHALGRFGTPEEVVSAITWLLAPSASWVTGQIVGVDGGLSSVRTMS